jgi:hypothetical protein
MGHETQEGTGNLKFVNFKLSFSNNDMYGFMNGGITTAENSKQVICLPYEVDRLGNTTTLKRLFQKYTVIRRDKILCNFVQRENFLHTDHIYC